MAADSPLKDASRVQARWGSRRAGPSCLQPAPWYPHAAGGTATASSWETGEMAVDAAGYFPSAISGITGCCLARSARRSRMTSRLAAIPACCSGGACSW